MTKGKLTLSKREAIARKILGWESQNLLDSRGERSEVGRCKRCCLTVSGDVELDEVLEVLYVRRQSLDLVIAQPKFAKPVETEEILKKI